MTFPQYLQYMKDANSETVYKIPIDNQHSDGADIFIGVLRAFGLSIEGFNHCLPILSIDDTHLNEKYSGVLLAATRVDPDRGLFPLTFAVVNMEDDSLLFRS